MQLSRVAFFALLLLCAPSIAEAYPQFQFSTGNSSCSDCHYAPMGGGLINDWGRSEAGDTISRGGDGSFLHGLWDSPEWIQFGADLRVLGGIKDNSTDPRYLLFPMQGDTYVRFAVGDFSLYLNIGPRAQPRTPRKPFVQRLVSREHYLSWKPSSKTYVRAGRYIPAFGIRHVDHTVYTRRFTGHYIMEETYNVGGGYLGGKWEIHGSAFMPADPFTSAGPKEKGATVYAERFVGDSGAVAGQARVGLGPESKRYTAGVVGKWFFEGPRLLLLGELDFTFQDFDASGSPSRGQLASYLGASYWPIDGLMLTLAQERFDEDLEISSTYRDAYGFHVQFFPRAHFEVQATTKVEVQGQYSDPSLLAFLMLHYYL
jgi:hypothetical protein